LTRPQSFPGRESCGAFYLSSVRQVVSNFSTQPARSSSLQNLSYVSINNFLQPSFEVAVRVFEVKKTNIVAISQPSDKNSKKTLVIMQTRVISFPYLVRHENETDLRAASFRYAATKRRVKTLVSSDWFSGMSRVFLVRWFLLLNKSHFCRTI